MNSSPSLGAVILNYRKTDLTLRSVRAVQESARSAGMEAEVVVVDNSAAETARALEGALQGNRAVRLIANPQNTGFARGNNQGVEVLNSDVLLFINNDAFLNPEALRNGIEVLRERPETGIWAPSLVGEDGRPQVSCSRLPTMGRLMKEYLFGVHEAWYADAGRWTVPTEVESAVAACWMIPRRVWEVVGPLDDSFFFTSEDTDYCRRVRERGFRIVWDPRNPVVHIGSASQPWSWRKDPFLHRGRVRYFRKHEGSGAAVLASVVVRTGLILRGMKACLNRESRSSSTR